MIKCTLDERGDLFDDFGVNGREINVVIDYGVFEDSADNFILLGLYFEGVGLWCMFQSEEERPAVQRLEQLSQSVPLPESLPAELRLSLRAWLVSRASCPIRFEWTDLGYAFWPRWVRRGECGDASSAGAAPKRRRFYIDDDSDEDEDDAAEAPQSDAASVNESALVASACSWPPGMSCVPGSFKNLHILRWHCSGFIPYVYRLRKTLDTSKTLWTAERLKKEVERRKRRRKKYRCIWVKVPYPVPEDCVCSC